MKSPRIFLVAAAILMGLLALPLLPASAQVEPIAGVKIEALGIVPPSTGSGETLQLIRLTIDPGIAVSIRQHPGPVVMSVVSGVFITSFDESTAVATRNDAAANSMPEPLTAGYRYYLFPGDAVEYHADTTRNVIQNGGRTPVVLIASVYFEDGAAGFTFEPATPLGNVITLCRSCR